MTLVTSNAPVLLNPSHSPYRVGDSQRHIVASPYPDIFLDLQSLNHIHTDVARRLQRLKSYGNHLDADYSAAFNFDECFRGVRYDAVLYVVVFRSTIAKDAVSTQLFDKLHAQDRESYMEATDQVGGLLKYWFGTINEDRRNLATCLWVDQEHAKSASKLPAHQKAVDIVRLGIYEEWKIQRYRLHLGPGRVQFEPL